MATIKDFLKRQGQRAIINTSPIGRGINAFNDFNNIRKSIFGKKEDKASNYTSGATQTNPVKPKPDPVLRSNLSNQNIPKKPETTQLPKSGEQFVSSLMEDRSATPATPTTPVTSNKEVSFNQFNQEQNTPAQQSSVPAPVQQSSVPASAQQQTDPFTEYINSLNADDYRTASQRAQEDAQRLADIQNQREALQTAQRREQQNILDDRGGLRSGAVAESNQYTRRSNQELADLALQESAAARSASVSSDNLQNLLDLGQQTSGSAEQFTLGEGDVRYDAQGNVIARGGGAGGGFGDDTVNPQVSAFADAVLNNQAKLSDIPQDLRGAVLQQVNANRGNVTTPQQKNAIDQANVALNIFDDLLNEEGDVEVSGALNRLGMGLIPGSDARGFNKSLQSIQSIIGFDELQAMRDASPTGGALGQVSEREIDFLQSLQGTIDTSLPDELLQKNLNRIKESFETLRLINSPEGTTGVIDGLEFTKQGDSLITDVPGEGLQKINPSGDPPLVPFEGFNTVGSDTNTASKLADAIMQVESGGRQVKGASGEFGTFQFMPATWEIISKQIAGTVLPQTAENERAVAEAKIADLLSQGNSPKEVALIWNTSLGGAEKPFVRKGTNSKGVAYDSGAYAQKVVNTLNKLK